MDDRFGLFGFIDKMYFKPMENGWLFKEPVFWRRRTYLLTDAEKMRLVGPVRRMALVSAIMVIVAIQVQVFVSDRFHVPFWLLLAAVLALAIIVSWIFDVVFFRPVLSDLTTTNERITFSDQLRTQARELPKALIIAWLVASLAFVAFFGVGLSSFDGWDWQSAAGIAFFAICSLYPATLLVLRGR